MTLLLFLSNHHIHILSRSNFSNFSIQTFYFDFHPSFSSQSPSYPPSQLYPILLSTFSSTPFHSLSQPPFKPPPISPPQAIPQVSPSHYHQKIKCRWKLREYSSCHVVSTSWSSTVTALTTHPNSSSHPSPPSSSSSRSHPSRLGFEGVWGV